MKKPKVLILEPPESHNTNQKNQKNRKDRKTRSINWDARLSAREKFLLLLLSREIIPMMQSSVLIHFYSVFRNDLDGGPIFWLGKMAQRGIVRESSGMWEATRSGKNVMSSILSTTEDNHLKQKFHSEMMGQRGACLLWAMEIMQSSETDVTRKNISLLFVDKFCPWPEAPPIKWGLSRGKGDIINLCHHLKNLGLLEEIREGKDSVFVSSRIGQKVQKLYRRKNRVFSNYKEQPNAPD